LFLFGVYQNQSQLRLAEERSEERSQEVGTARMDFNSTDEVMSEIIASASIFLRNTKLGLEPFRMAPNHILDQQN